jgi:hypothetical protein
VTIKPLVVLPRAADKIALSRREDWVLFVGTAGPRTTTTWRSRTRRDDGWARPSSGGIAGIARLHKLIAELEEDDETEQVAIRIETDRGLWVQALLAAGYRVWAINPAAGGPLPRAAQRLGCQERRR